MLIKFLTITFMLASAVAFAQATDRLQLNVRLHPIQTLSIGTTESSPAKKNISLPEYIMVSSASGFQVKVNHEIYNSKEEEPVKNHDYTGEYDLIDHPSGVMHKKYKVNQNIESIIKKTGSSVHKNNLLVFTIISQ